MKMKIKLIGPDCKIPAKKRDGDACFDCYSKINYYIKPKKRAKIPLGFAIELVDGYEAIIRPRSGLSLSGIDIALGTVDSNYRGEVSAIVSNNGDKVFYIEKGDRICQMAIRKTESVELDQVEELSETNRGENGFGSSGLK